MSFLIFLPELEHFDLSFTVNVLVHLWIHSYQRKGNVSTNLYKNLEQNTQKDKVVLLGVRIQKQAGYRQNITIT